MQPRTQSLPQCIRAACALPALKQRCEAHFFTAQRSGCKIVLRCLQVCLQSAGPCRRSSLARAAYVQRFTHSQQNLRSPLVPEGVFHGKRDHGDASCTLQQRPQSGHQARRPRTWIGEVSFRRDPQHAAGTKHGLRMAQELCCSPQLALLHRKHADAGEERILPQRCFADGCAMLPAAKQSSRKFCAHDRVPPRRMIEVDDQWAGRRGLKSLRTQHAYGAKAAPQPPPPDHGKEQQQQPRPKGQSAEVGSRDQLDT